MTDDQNRKRERPDEVDPAQDALVTPPPTDSIDAAYGMEARMTTSAVRLPDSGELTDKQRQQIRDAVAAHQKRYRLAHSYVAMQIGVRADSVVSQVLSGKYKADSDPLLRKLNSWVDDDERRRRLGQPLGLYETSVLISIRDAAAIAKQNARTEVNRDVHGERARIVMALGPSGVGKSAGASALAAWDPNSILIRIKQRCGNDAGIAKAIVDAAPFRDAPKTRSKIAFVCDRLRHSGRLLIVDEAHRLSTSGYEFIRDLADDAGIPILLLGTQRMQERAVGPRAGVGKLYDEQFSRRVSYVVDLLRGTDGTGGSKRPFFTIEEIVAIFKSDQVKLTADGAEMLCAIACLIGGGMLGQAANVYEKAFRTARKHNGIIDAKLIWIAVNKVMMTPGLIDAAIQRRIEEQLMNNRKLDARTARPAAASA